MKRITALAVFLAFLAATHPGVAADWVELGETTWGMVCFDRSSIKRVGPLVCVSSKQIFRPEAAAALGKTLPHLAGVAYSVSQDVIDCGKGHYEQMTIVFYGGDHRVLHDTANDRGKYRDIGPRPIPPDTPIGWLAEVVCPPADSGPAR